MEPAIIARATVTEDGQILLDEKLSLPPGRVLVRVETIPTSPRPKVHLLDLIGQSGLARTRAEVDAQVRALREEWGN